jgi:endo-1,4-beta-mannosidase
MRRAFDAAGARQLVGWGGSGHRGDHGEDMEAVLRTGAVDFATLHLYPFHTHPALRRLEPWSARASAAVEVGARLLRDRADLARRYGVPLLLEEFGWKTGAHTLAEERLQVTRGLLRAAHALQVGTLPWMIAERGRPDYDGLLIRPEQRALTASLRAL